MISSTVRNWQFGMMSRVAAASIIIRPDKVTSLAAAIANWNPPVDLVRLPDTRFPGVDS